MNALGIAVAFLLLAWVSLLYVPFRWRPVGLFLIMEKAMALAYTPFIALAGVALAIAGVWTGSWWIACPAGIAALGALLIVVRVGAARVDLTGVLGADWMGRLRGQRLTTMVGRWWTGPLPASGEARLKQDVPFATVGKDRALLCDLWQPLAGVRSSGVAVIYLHGSAYYVFDKDFGTRPLFGHLASAGHRVVDVAYRLFPETGPEGMVGDALRAVAWVKRHAAELAVDPERIVLMGGSAGGHLALLAAYGHDHPRLCPAELLGEDLRVAAVASLYGQVGLDTLYRHTAQEKVCHPEDLRPDWDQAPPRAMVRLFGEKDAVRLKLGIMMHAGRCDWMMGGTPSEVPERYAGVSVMSYLRPGCPPTLLMHGTHDEMAPVAAVRELERRLKQAGVPVAAVYLPHTDHMFDLVGTRWSPAARVTFHVLERFLAGIEVAAVARRPESRRDSEARSVQERHDLAGAPPELRAGSEAAGEMVPR